MKMPNGRPAAIACIRGGEETPCLRGTVSFWQCSDGVLVSADLWGLPDNGTGMHGFHIHQGDNCCGAGFPGTQGHYDPQQQRHPAHAGDLPPLIACQGRAYMVFLTNRFCLRDVIGRTVVVHADADDLHSQPAGNSGEKIGCGVIRRL